MSLFFASESRQRSGVRRRITSLLATALLAVFATPAWAQRNDGDEMIELNLSGNVKVTTLLDLMSKQLDVRFLHGAELGNRSVTVYTPAELPKKVFPTLLGTLLREANLAIVDTEVPGWKRIVDAGKLAENAPTGDSEDISRRNGPAGAVTEVVRVKYIDTTTASTTLKPFLGKPGPSNGSSLTAFADQKLLIVTGYAGDVKQIKELLALIDQPDEEGVIDFYSARLRPPSMLIGQYEAVTKNESTKKGSAATGPKLFVDKTGRRVVVAGRRELVDSALRLLKQLDSGSAYLTRVYRLEYIGADRLDDLINGFVTRDSEEGTDTVETVVDAEGNLLVVRAGADIHQQIETLIEELDQPIEAESSPIRFYKLKNATAIEVLYSLLALQEVTGSGVQQAGGLGGGAFGTLGGVNVGGVSNAMGFGGQGQGAINPAVMQQSATLRDINAAGGGSFGLVGQNLGNNIASTRNPNQNAALGGFGGAGALGGAGGFGNAAAGGFGGLGGGLGGGGVATLPGGARVSADVSTNSLIVYAPANVQSLYEKLIRSLDQRRPQVLIEADIVAINTTDNFSLGVEVSTGDRQGTNRLFQFTSFGLSEVDSNGNLTVNPSLGFNGVLVDPEVADVIVQALSGHTRARVLSSPKILVNDNQTGTLNSISSIPFQAFSQGETTTLNGLGGNQEAGTTIQVTPHINEDDHLQLQFDIEFSSFVGEGTAVLPPARQIDRVGSVVTIPDGKTIVVGGLKRSSDTDNFTGVPWLERIPVLRELTSLQSNTQTTTSFFLFIRPRIMRDSRFRDLKFLSDLETQDAQLHEDYPQSHPLLVPCPVPPTPTGGLRPQVESYHTETLPESYPSQLSPIEYPVGGAQPAAPVPNGMVVQPR
ncbi:MAG: secretin N-terminal domain-containing protein [Planctomycetota bacterium]